MDANERSSLLPVHTAQPSKEPGGDTTEHKSISRAAETLSVLSIILFYLFTVISSSGCVIYSKVNKLHGTDSVLLVVITPKVIDQIWLMFGANILELSFGVAAATGKDEDERKVGRKANIIGKHFSTLSKAINIDIHLSLLAADRMHPAIAATICTLGAMLAMFCCWTSLVGINGLVEEFKGKVNDERESRGLERDAESEYGLGRGLRISGGRKVAWALAAGALCAFLTWLTGDVVVPPALFHDFISIISACDSIAGSKARTGKIWALCKDYGRGKSLQEGWSRYWHRG